MHSEPVSYRLSRSVGFLVIDHPPVNVLGAVVREGLANALNTALADVGARAIVIACAGRTFSAGADIGEFGAPMSEPSLQSLFAAIEASPKPVVAALHGTALGGGLEAGIAGDHAWIDSRRGRNAAAPSHHRCSGCARHDRCRYSIGRSDCATARSGRCRGGK
jgi:enoyl-CoA hydratase/carnithine racemase